MLGENGILLISATLDKKSRQILVGPEITTRGFIYVRDSYKMIEEIKKISKEIGIILEPLEYPKKLLSVIILLL